MKTTLICTVLNEQESIGKFINSVVSQTRLPSEVIIVDGGSNDKTIANIKHQIAKSKYKRKFKLFIKKGNRSVGRNEAIKKAKGEVILCSDAGCVLDRNWVKNITKDFKNKEIDVVSGFYRGRFGTIFEKCLIPYVLVMPDKVDSSNFLPATRSMAFRKEIWKKVGGFPEEYSHNEDFVFAKLLKKIKANIKFSKDAIVYWRPRKNLRESFIMFYRFAFGDAESEILRPKVLLIFSRYFLALYFLFLSFLEKSWMGFLILFVSFVVYMIWSIKKNYKYVKNKKAFIILPTLQVASDIAVLIGTTLGLLKRIMNYNFTSYVKRNKFLFFVLLTYLGLMLSTLEWGIPNIDHPFPYFMDEWHQLNAVRSTFAYGTPNTAGAANGTMLYFILSGFYLIPFTMVGFVNPVALEINDFVNRQRIFDLLRLNTLFWGASSIFLIYKISDYIRASKKLSIVLFTFSPIWLILSGYFKYDIPTISFLLVSFLFFFRYIRNPTGLNFLVAAVPAGLAVSVKISAIPLLPLYVILYFMFGNLRNIRHLFLGVLLFVFIVLLFGMPDTIFGKGNILDYLYDNIIRTPNYSVNYNLKINHYLYLLLKHYPIVFGYGLLFLFIGALISQIRPLKKGVSYFLQTRKTLVFLIISFLVFLGSLLPLRIFAGGNRSLALLPLIVLIVSLIYKNSKRKFLLIPIILIALVFQIYQSFAWLYIKYRESLQGSASSWIRENIERGEKIGIENIPIYQMLPDIIQKEYYFREYGVPQRNLYRYEIVGSKTKNLPKVIILTNSEIEIKLLRNSPKKEIYKRLTNEGYKKIKVFTPHLTYFKLFAKEEDFYLSGLLIATPLILSIFEKN